ncbi:hypothetical protein GV829_11705 [Sphingomonas lacunae]|uniref:Uncharacterized protein n=1 Tax=Sphingomonas lacunae TaxID=2698828 RepID=A0A6M4AV93_9SPHN|nr:hypothetical protein [Sphingomonas lacunae]QJQ33023.1 hypothetical protein GV829_11705 [Sphingomonas lacunae]
MEILPFFYALLAVLTGVSAGDRVALAERAPVAACAAQESQACTVVQTSSVPASRPVAGLPLMRLLLDVPHWTAIDTGRIFRVAGFAVRRI